MSARRGAPMAGAARKDHHPVAFFRVEIDSIDSASFRKCGGLKSESEVFEYQEGGDNDTVRKLIGPTKASNLVLTKGYVSDPALFKWRDEIAASGTKKIARRNGSVVALAPDGKTEGGRRASHKARAGALGDDRVRRQHRAGAVRSARARGREALEGIGRARKRDADERPFAGADPLALDGSLAGGARPPRRGGVRRAHRSLIRRSGAGRDVRGAVLR